MKLIHKAVGDEIALQSWLRPALTTVGPNKDYGQFREPLDAVDRVLRASHLESMAMDFARVGFESVDAGQLRRRLEFARKALRVHVLRMLLGNMPFRQLSRTIEGIKGVSKSVLERASQCFTAEPVRWMGQVFIEMVAEADRAAELGLAEPQSMETCLVDSTCWPTNIHFPVDWVLLRDVSRTLLKAVILIRRAGMRARMPAEPEVFARQMNRLCIEMTHTRRRANAKRARKQVLRKMKRLLRTIGEHAQRHRNRLDQAYASTHTSARQAARIVKRIVERIVERIDERIDAMLAQMPATINQAHERIIGARPVPNAEKILRVYEPDVQTVVRGKASGAVEFGNTLMISENVTGLITDWQLYQGMTPAEWRQFDLS
ncbi:MAG: hypothetical protein J6386_25590, partial [Candidatus Synoicihabitans palmerolidicus]|nr:hypothetical protein [Candidatus Synoicihabitans palmerolidicus]